MNNCGNCYYSRTPVDGLECHNNPPAFLDTSGAEYDNDLFEGFFPTVDYESWCGCWKPREEAKDCNNATMHSRRMSKSYERYRSEKFMQTLKLDIKMYSHGAVTVEGKKVNVFVTVETDLSVRIDCLYSDEFGVGQSFEEAEEDLIEGIKRMTK